MNQPSYCLDVVVGYNERDREELISYLEEKAKFEFQIGKLQRGMWQGFKILRIETTQAQELYKKLHDDLRSGDDYSYEMHATFTDANRSDTWLPDLDTEYGYERFDLVAAAT